MWSRFFDPKEWLIGGAKGNPWVEGVHDWGKR